MKKKILSFCAIAAFSIIISNDMYGQAWIVNGTGLETNSATTGDVIVNGPSKLGIGMIPTEELSVNGDIGIDGNFTFEQSTIFRNIDGGSYTKGLNIYANEGENLGSAIRLSGEGNTFNPGGIEFLATDFQVSPSESAFTFWSTLADGTWENRLLEITKDGQVIIGEVPMISTDDYKLYVGTGILTERLKVATVGTGNWADYVFSDDYKLNSLNEVASYISENKHLPNVPSAADVEKNGYDVTEMDATLLRKIEELTLYVIEQQKQIDNLKKELGK